MEKHRQVSLAFQPCADKALLLESLLAPVHPAPSAALGGRAGRESSSHFLLIFVVSWKSTDRTGLKTTQKSQCETALGRGFLCMTVQSAGGGRMRSF